jgi:hypothetical protein
MERRFSPKAITLGEKIKFAKNFTINFDSYTVHYRPRRDQSTKRTEIMYFFIFFYNGSFMFRQNNAIVRERLFSLLSHFSVNMVADKS